MMKRVMLGLAVAAAVFVAGCDWGAEEEDGDGTPQSNQPETAAAPVASKDTGTYSTALSVTLTTATEDGSIYYTVNGSDPSATNGTLYAGAVAIAVTTTLKAVTVKEGLTDSAVMVKVYTIAAGGEGGKEPEPEPPVDPDPPGDPELEKDFTTSANSTGLTITGYSGLAADLVIPGTIGGKTVTAIGNYAFNSKYLTSITIPHYGYLYRKQCVLRQPVDQRNHPQFGYLYRTRAV
jgi:hypothetical protein